jgi:hypothetical protein
MLQQKVNDERREVRPVCLVVCLLDTPSLQLSRPTSHASDRLGFLCQDKTMALSSTVIRDFDSYNTLTAFT